MSELHLPLDYEQLPEFWRLKELLQERAKEKLHPLKIEQAALQIFHRLFVTLGYLARSTNRPGLLIATGPAQFRAALEPLYGEDCDPVKLIIDCGLLATVSADQPDAELWCPMFARLNPHLAGNFKRPSDKGNLISRAGASLKKIGEEAAQQAMFLPLQVFKKLDGTDFSSSDCIRSIALINGLDRMLTYPTPCPRRVDAAFTAGLMATAQSVTARFDADALRNFQFWVCGNNTHPVVPQTTEELLQDFDRFMGMSRNA